MKKEEVRRDNSFGIAAVVLGIINIFFSLLIPFVGLIFGILVLIFGIKQRKIMRNGWSRAGIILGIITIILAIIIWIVAVYLLNNPEFISSIQQLQQLNQ